MTYIIRSINEKVYVSHEKYGCLAVYCKMCAEYYGINENYTVEYIESKFKSTFKEFQEKCWGFYNIEVIDDYCPNWAK